MSEPEVSLLRLHSGLGQYLGHECPSYTNRSFGLGYTNSPRRRVGLLLSERAYV